MNIQNQKQNLQVLVLISLTLAFALSIFFLWLGLSPEESFLAYLARWDVLAPVMTILGVYAGLVAYLFGWNPQIRFLEWFRSSVVIPALNSPPLLMAVLLVLLIGVAVQISFVTSFKSPYYEEVSSAILAGDYALADLKLGNADIAAEHVADLLVINDSFRQRFFKTSQSDDPDLCRVYMNYFARRGLSFTTAWERYLVLTAMGSCAEVLEARADAIRYFESAAQIAQWISEEHVRRSKRQVATAHFHDTNGTVLKDKKVRYRTIIALLATDADPTAQRMLGTSYYLLGEFSKAIDGWNRLMESSRSNPLERKKISNNTAMAYAALEQYQRALSTAEQGLEAPFNTANENERREQIRLLSTKSLALLSAGRCDEADTTWRERNALQQQALSSCSRLISAQLKACYKDPARGQVVLEDLLLGVGQDPKSFIDRTRSAVDAIVEQADKRFSECYLGLGFRREPIEASLTAY